MKTLLLWTFTVLSKKGPLFESFRASRKVTHREEYPGALRCLTQICAVSPGEKDRGESAPDGCDIVP